MNSWQSGHVYLRQTYSLFLMIVAVWDWIERKGEAWEMRKEQVRKVLKTNASAAKAENESGQKVFASSHYSSTGSELLERLERWRVFRPTLSLRIYSLFLHRTTWHYLLKKGLATHKGQVTIKCVVLALANLWKGISVPIKWNTNRGRQGVYNFEACLCISWNLHKGGGWWLVVGLLPI